MTPFEFLKPKFRWLNSSRDQVLSDLSQQGMNQRCTAVYLFTWSTDSHKLFFGSEDGDSELAESSCFSFVFMDILRKLYRLQPFFFSLIILISDASQTLSTYATFMNTERLTVVAYVISVWDASGISVINETKICCKWDISRHISRKLSKKKHKT